MSAWGQLGWGGAVLFGPSEHCWVSMAVGKLLGFQLFQSSSDLTNELRKLMQTGSTCLQPAYQETVCPRPPPPPLPVKDTQGRGWDSHPKKRPETHTGSTKGPWQDGPTIKPGKPPLPAHRQSVELIKPVHVVSAKPGRAELQPAPPGCWDSFGCPLPNGGTVMTTIQEWYTECCWRRREAGSPVRP